MKRILKIVAIIAIAAVFIGTFVFLYHKSKKPAATYEVETASYADISRTTVLTGNIEPRDKVEIKPQINGIISAIFKQPGDKVQTGDIIARVKVIPGMEELNAADNRIRIADISLAQAEKDFARADKLYEKRTARDQMQIIREGVSASGGNYSTTLIRSTINGIILDIPVKVGNSVIMSNTMNDGTTIATVADMGNLIFKGNIDETDVGMVRVGMPMTITVGAIEGKTFPATLEYISPQVKTSTDGTSAGQFEIKAAIGRGYTSGIRSGYSANANIILQKATHVISIPEGCIEFAGDTSYVYVLTNTQPQTFTRRRVYTGLSDGVRIEIKSGLKAGDKVRGNAVTADESAADNKENK